MMNLIKICLFSLLFLLGLGSGYSLFAQSTGASTQFRMNLRNAQQNLEAIGVYRNTSSSRLQAIEARYASVEGTPYLHEDWVDGDIHLSNGFIHKRVKIKLDIYNDMILYKGKAGLIALHKDYIKRFVLDIGATQQIFEKINLNDQTNTFYEVLYSGNTRLLKYYQKELIKANTTEAYGDQKYDEFVDRDTYYLELGTDLYEKVRLNKGSVLKKLPGYEKEIKNYLKNSAIDLRNENGLIELLKYYDAL